MLNMSHRDRAVPPVCPFCRQRIERPEELDGMWFEFDGGVCTCGAHFAVDPTARNGGAVLLQTLVQASGGDWDQALTLSPGVDYDDAFLGLYNTLTHRIGGRAFGTIYFVRLRPPADQPETSNTH